MRRLPQLRPVGLLGGLALLFLGSALLRMAEVAPHAAHAVTAAFAQESATADPAPPVAATGQGDADYVLAALAAREADLEARERAVAEREQTLTLVRQEVDRNLAALAEAEAELRATLALADGAAAADLDQLTQMYQNMKPKEAAALFETMDPNFAAGFLGQMPATAAGAIMAGLQPETAYRISLVLAGRNMQVPAE